MKKKSLKYSLTLFLATSMMLFFSGCDLEFEPYGPVSLSSFWKTEADLTQAVNALYTYSYNEEVTGRGTFWYENCSDNMITGRSNSTADRIKNFVSSAEEGYIQDPWYYMYILIARCNDIIRYVPEMDVPDDQKNFALGQAYFFRGYAYLWLAPWYGDGGYNGGIPIVTEESSVETVDVPRPATVLDNYDMVIADLRKAADLLPLFSQMATDDYGRPHRAASWAFAARAALYAAQWDAKYFDTVLEMCDKVMGMTGADKRELYADYTTLFTKANNFSSEYIYSILGNGVEGPKFHGMMFQNGGFGFYNTWGYYQPTAELYKAYEQGDVRRDATILAPGQHIQFMGHDIHWEVAPETTTSPTHLTCRKFLSIFAASDCIEVGDVNPSGNNMSNKLGTVVMRYADILLMKAEALIWKNGEGDNDAKALLNQIRKRAGLPENSAATKAQLKNERRCELAFEFQPSRHLDLVRWGDAQATYAKTLHGFEEKYTANDGSYIFDPSTEIEVWPARTFDPQKNQVFPIPANAINSAKNLAQNKGL